MNISNISGYIIDPPWLVPSKANNTKLGQYHTCPLGRTIWTVLSNGGGVVALAVVVVVWKTRFQSKQRKYCVRQITFPFLLKEVFHHYLVSGGFIFRSLNTTVEELTLPSQSSHSRISCPNASKHIEWPPPGILHDNIIAMRPNVRIETRYCT